MPDTTTMILRPLETPAGPCTIRQRPTDGYVCLTDICQAAGKLYADWRRQERVEEYLQASRRSMGIPIDLLITSVMTGPNDQRGTWGHPRIALRVAQWCSPTFEVAVDGWLEEWLKRGMTMTQTLLDHYLLYTPRPWERRFEREFYYHLYRVWGKLSQFPPDGQSHWGAWTGRILNRMIYDRHFPPFVMTALRQRNPRTPSGGRRRKHMQLLAADLGDQQLRSAIDFTLKFLRIAHSPAHFWRMLDTVAPARQGEIPFAENFQAPAGPPLEPDHAPAP